MVLHWATCISEESQQHTTTKKCDRCIYKNASKKNKYAVVRYFSDKDIFSHAFSILNRNTKWSEPDVRSNKD